MTTQENLDLTDTEFAVMYKTMSFKNLKPG